MGVGRGMLRTLHDVGQLEHHAQNQSGGEVHGEIPDQELPPRHIEDEQRDHDGPADVRRLGHDQNRDFARRVRLVLVRAEVALQEILVILDPEPEQRGETVEHECQPRLGPMNRSPRAAGREANQR